jgi:hypothetical protein
MGCNWRPLRKDGLPGAYFHETCKCPWILCANLVDQISPISNNLRGMNGSRFIYAAGKGHCAHFRETQNLAINICGYPYRRTEFYRNWTKNVENTSNFLSRWVKNNFYWSVSAKFTSAQQNYVDIFYTDEGTRWRSRLRPRITSRKVAGAIPECHWNFSLTESFWPHYDLGGWLSL